MSLLPLWSLCPGGLNSEPPVGTSDSTRVVSILARVLGPLQHPVETSRFSTGPRAQVLGSYNRARLSPSDQPALTYPSPLNAIHEDGRKQNEYYYSGNLLRHVPSR